MGQEPTFFVLQYVTITRDPRTGLVVAIGGDERAAGILQTLGNFVEASGPRGPYHRQPHTMSVDRQRHGTTSAAHGLLLAGFGVYLDPTLNTLTTPGDDRHAIHRYLDQLAHRADEAKDDTEFAALLTEVAAQHDGLLPRLVKALIATWANWTKRLEAAGQATDLADDLAAATGTLSHLNWTMERIRHRAIQSPAALETSPPTPSPPKSAGQVAPGEDTRPADATCEDGQRCPPVATCAPHTPQTNARTGRTR
jgi:hypothetical protein